MARRELSLVVGIASSLACAALALTAAHLGIFALDRTTQAFLAGTRNAAFQHQMEAVSLLGQGTALAPLVVLATALMWRYSHRWALAFPVVMAGAGALQYVAKWAVDRPRPNAAAWGFPSGHALAVLVFFGVIAYLLCVSRTRRCWRCGGAALCATVVLAVGFSRLYLNKHWLSDVGGGFAFGLAYLLIAIWLVERIPARARTAAVPASPITPPPGPPSPAPA